MSELLFSVNLWGSEPYVNDDCWTGEEFATLEEAQAAFTFPGLFFTKSELRDVEYIELIRLDGEIQFDRKNPSFSGHKSQARDEWRQEIAMQAGMSGGCESYNEAMGYD